MVLSRSDATELCHQETSIQYHSMRELDWIESCHVHVHADVIYQNRRAAQIQSYNAMPDRINAFHSIEFYCVLSIVEVTDRQENDFPYSKMTGENIVHHSLFARTNSTARKSPELLLCFVLFCSDLNNICSHFSPK